MTETQQSPTSKRRSRRLPLRGTGAQGFTLIELLVVIGIIVLLISILVPVVSQVRIKGQAASTKNQVLSIVGAIERYKMEQGQYPGPLANDQLCVALRATGTAPTINHEAGGALQNSDSITQSENLVLGLLGGLKWGTGGQLVFDPAMVGRGMVGMTPSRPKKFSAYLEVPAAQLSTHADSAAPGGTTGKYSDGAGDAQDSPIPEILDSFASPMPILYLRARTGAVGVVRDNVTENPADPMRQYELSDIAAYVMPDPSGRSIGEGKRIKLKDYTGNAAGSPSATHLPHGLQTVDDNQTLDKSAGGNYKYPYDAFPYFNSPAIQPTNAAQKNATGTPRQKDTFILISAGPDRVYGTTDDICNFGDVVP